MPRKDGRTAADKVKDAQAAKVRQLCYKDDPDFKAKEKQRKADQYWEQTKDEAGRLAYNALRRGQYDRCEEAKAVAIPGRKRKRPSPAGEPCGVDERLMMTPLIAQKKQTTRMYSDSKRGFTTKIALRHHHHNHSHPYLCSQCKEVFRSWPLFSAHMQSHPGEKSYTLPDDDAFLMVGNTDICKKARTNKKPNVCYECGEGFMLRQSLENHARTHLIKVKITPSKPSYAEEAINPCPISRSSHKCTYCGDTLNTYANLIRHINSTHIQKYKCPECGEWFIQEICLKAHMINHTEEKAFKCCDCDEAFTKSDSLTAHVRGVHRKERTCHHCGKELSTWNSLMKHIQVVHTNKEKPDTSDCGKVEKYGRSGVPTSNHSVEMQCTQCGEVFSQAIGKKDTGGPNPIICPPCTNQFSEMFGINLDS